MYLNSKANKSLELVNPQYYIPLIGMYKFMQNCCCLEKLIIDHDTDFLDQPWRFFMFIPTLKCITYGAFNDGQCLLEDPTGEDFNGKSVS